MDRYPLAARKPFRLNNHKPYYRKLMFNTPHHILAGIALIFAVLSFIWPSYPLLGVSVILLAISAFLP